MLLARRQAVERLDDSGIRQHGGFFDLFAADQFGRDARCRDRRRAPLDEIPDRGNFLLVVAETNRHFEEIAAVGIAEPADAVIRIEPADITRGMKVVENLLRVSQHG